ncbi:hypothetical protein [Tenacibaculum soleae]|nr:hypothetical protein [Tenacibaculum soleae]
MKILLIIILVKQLVLGSEFNLIKWIKYKRKYWDDYCDWLRKKP